MALYGGSEVHTFEGDEMMKRYLPIIAALLLVGVFGYVAITKKRDTGNASSEYRVFPQKDIVPFSRQPTCVQMPYFLRKRGIAGPVAIDLSQKRFKGIAFLYGRKLNRVLHTDEWEKFGHLGTYTLDRKGNIYLVPMPFISIHAETFDLQKDLYRLDSQTGELSTFMHFNDVTPTANNPYGLSAIAYDCDDGTLWVAALDGSDYNAEHGVLYHIDPASKHILQKIEGKDLLSLYVMKNKKGEKFLLAGSARKNLLYAYTIENGSIISPPFEILELPAVNERIRKIKIKQMNELVLETIPFSYTLITQTAQKDRNNYTAFWNEEAKKWYVKQQ
jgi:hypothetical protein